jgi:hypothetical protein
MLIRSGAPRPLYGTAPAFASPADVNAKQAFNFFSNPGKTVWVRIDNTGGVPLRVFPQEPPGLDSARWLDYYEIATGTYLEGMFDFHELWLAGNGGTCAFKAMLGLAI